MIALISAYTSRSFYYGSPSMLHRSLALTCFLMPVAVALSHSNHYTETEAVKHTAHKNKKLDGYNSTKEDSFWKGEEGSKFLKSALAQTQGERPNVTSMAESAKERLFQLKDKLSPSKGLHKFMNMSRAFSSLVTGKNKEDALDSIVSSVQNSAEKGDGGITDTAGFSSVLSVMQKHSEKIQKVLDDQFGKIDFSFFTPAALWYYLEHEDERKNPSWKRLQHRFHKSIDIKVVEDLNDSLQLAELIYCDSPEELKKGLEENEAMPLELLYYQMESKPSQPSHFVAIKKKQSWWSNYLEIVIVVRGTKTISDAITDVFMEAADYRGGKAHAGIVDSGKWLAEEHSELFEELKKNSSKRKIKLSLIGHSLGAGTAAIAGMELKDRKDMEVSVVGFGCPALLSEDLSKSTEDFITTVICDSDVVPRTSGGTLANAALDIMEYDRYPKLLRDVKLAIEALGEYSPKVATEARRKQVMEYIESVSDNIKAKLLKPRTEERVTPVLFPPGKCVHFYRDGHSMSGSIPPCKFFGEIDVTRTMVDDHLIPTGYGKIFLDLMRVYYEDENFKFDHDEKENTMKEKKKTD